MKWFSQRESVLLGYSPQRSFENSMRKSDTSPEMDFSDVFGGPPRRFSIQASRARYSFSEAAMDPEPEEDATVLSADEKPVFGAETVNRRAYPRDDFFDDIFKGDEIKSFNSPRRSSRDFFGSTLAGSRVMSPSRPMPPKSEPFSTSFPSQFSLPGKVPTKPKYSGQFGSTSNRGPHNKKDGGVPNGISNGHTSDTSLSRFSSQANELQGETRNDQPLYLQSPLSREVRNSHQESSGETKSDEKGIDIKSKRSETKEVPINSGQFHFSIYKWAGSGVQLLMPLGGSGKSRFKDRFRTERCSSSNGRIESDFMDRHLPTVEEHATSLVTDSVSLEVNDGNNGTREDKKVKSSSNIEEGNDILSKHETNEKETHLNKFQTPKTEPKPLHEVLNDENQEQDNGSKGKENAVKNKDAAKNDANVKKKDAKRINSYPAEVTDASLQNSEPNSGDAFGKTRATGKVREFVKIFNHESSEKIKNDLGSKSTRWNQMNIRRKENGFNNAVNTDGKVHILNKTKIPETSSMEDGNLNKNKVKEDSQSNTSTHKKSGLSTKDKNASQFTEPLPNNFGNKVEPRAEPVHGYFQVEELSDAVEKVSQSSGESEQIRASNAKIQQWSSGRKGNIRSLLSTLQFVLWPESGWKPVPLVDLIEGSAVKRAYQRALLCLHPDKLQQKGAASHQKYIAEGVFDILQEAWDHFNSLGGI